MVRGFARAHAPRPQIADAEVPPGSRQAAGMQRTAPHLTHPSLPFKPPPRRSVRGHELTRRFGEGAAAVDALRGVERRLRAGHVHGDHGPVRLRQVDADAHPRRARPRRRAAGSRSTARASTTLERPRAHAAAPARQVGFIFQSYNLLPVLTAEQNILLPVRIGGDDVDEEWLETLIDTVGLEDRRDHRPERAVGRPGAAGRRRARADHPPRGRVRRRADRQPRLERRPRTCSTCCAARSTSSARRS